MSRRKRSRIYGYLLIALVLVASAEVISYVGMTYFIQPRDTSAFFDTPKIERAAFERYVRLRDELLGWPAPSAFGGEGFDVSGSRPIPAFPKIGSECISLYGNSFTYGAEVTDAEAWSNVLSKKIGCRVANYGVIGYGTDQAYLRFRSNTKDAAELVILGIFATNLMRNVNQYQYFINGFSTFAIKPRFVLKDEKLKLIEMPKLTYDQLVDSFSRPTKYFKHEALMVGSSTGPQRMSFPYSFVLLKYVASDRLQNWLAGRPSWVDFYAKSHPSRALQITAMIVDRFRATASRRNKKMFVVIFPTRGSMNHYEKTGAMATRPLAALLAKRGVRTLDLHGPLLKKLGRRNYCTILAKREACAGHFNSEGNRIVAEIVHSYMKKHKILTQ